MDYLSSLNHRNITFTLSLFPLIKDPLRGATIKRNYWGLSYMDPDSIKINTIET